MKTCRFLSPPIAMTVSVLAVACGSTTNTTVGENGSSGGSSTGTGGASTTTQSIGGSTSTATGGSTAVTGQGGASAGGATASGTGGAPATGGAVGQGGAIGQGGGVGTGGSVGKGGAVATGGAVGNGGTTNGGAIGTGGKSMGGASNGGAATGGAVATGGAGATGTRTDGPCDVYQTASTPCVAAYSMVRALSKAYAGPLYQVRSGSSAQNTGTGGTLKDILMTADGYADTAAQDTFCSGTICTVAKLYDQSGNGNDLPVAKKGLSGGGTYAAMDDFESSATKGTLTVNGHKVYPLYMAAREGYRLASVGKAMPRGTSPQGIYMLADGTHYGTACCWDFGNVSTNPTVYGIMNTLFLGVAYWGKGAGTGPWFMADFEAGVWAGGSKQGDPGWGSLDGAASSPANTANPSMKVPFAFGILKTTTTNYALRMANAQTATSLTTAYSGALPKAMDNLGGIVLGVGGDNSNNSWGTFFEGAITAGAPSDATDLAVFQNVQAAGYPK